MADEGVKRRIKHPLLFGCAFLFVIAGAAVIMFLRYSAIGSKQKRTIADLRTLATVVEAYQVDFKHYPAPESFQRDLVPTYMIQPLAVDAWGIPYRYDCWKEDPKATGCDHYAVASAGMDGTFSPTPLRSVSEGAFTDPDEDIVIRDGFAVRYPARIGPFSSR